MQDTALGVEVSAKLGHVDAHHLEVQLHPALGFPLNRRDVHAVHSTGHVRGHLHEDHRERVRAAGQEVQPLNVHDAFDFTKTIAERHRGVVATEASVVVVQVLVPVGAVIHHEWAVEVVAVQLFSRFQEVAHSRFGVGTRRHREVRLREAAREVGIAVHRRRPTVTRRHRSGAVRDASLDADRLLLDLLRDAAPARLAHRGVERRTAIARNREAALGVPEPAVRDRQRQTFQLEARRVGLAVSQAFHVLERDARVGHRLVLQNHPAHAVDAEAVGASEIAPGLQPLTCGSEHDAIELNPLLLAERGRSIEHWRVDASVDQVLDPYGFLLLPVPLQLLIVRHATGVNGAALDVILVQERAKQTCVEANATDGLPYRSVTNAIQNEVNEHLQNSELVVAKPWGGIVTYVFMQYTS